MSFIEKLEDPEHPLLGPTLKGLKLFRIWQPVCSSPKLIYNSIHIFGTLFVVSQYVELWLIRDNQDLAMRNLSKTMLSTLCLVKANSFVYWHNHWASIVEYVSNLEKQQLSKKDRITASIIDGYTKYSRKITYFYWCLVAATAFAVTVAPLIKFLSSADYRYIIKNGTAPYPEILNSWFPFDRTRGIGYWISILDHSVLCIYGAGVISNYDSNAIVLMVFFNGQLKLLSENCARLFDEGSETVKHNEAVKKIKECHNHHVDLIKFSTILNSLLSPVMFLYVIICSLMIFASAVQLTMEGTTTMQRIWIAEYLLYLIAQLFIYCWHSNEVLHMSNEVAQGVYSSAWWSQSVPIRRSVVLLGGQLRKPIIFTAGPFTSLNIPTFVSILKGSYSYYTFLSQKEN